MYAHYHTNLFLPYIFKETDSSVVIKIHYSSASEIWKTANVLELIIFFFRGKSSFDIFCIKQSLTVTYNFRKITVLIMTFQLSLIEKKLATYRNNSVWALITLLVDGPMWFYMFTIINKTI